MKKVITYGTYDLLHHGHVRLLERAKALGDYLIVGVTADDFDKTRGKINVSQSLMERVESVRATGIADEIIIEEYEGQKIDDIRRFDIDIFTVGSDWKGHFDYLQEYCQVVYLERTEGISSTQIRSKESKLKFGFAGYSSFLLKYQKEMDFVNGAVLFGIYDSNKDKINKNFKNLPLVTDNYEELIQNVDAVFIVTNPNDHYKQIKIALQNKKHVLCEAPITIKESEYQELVSLAHQNNCILMEAIKTAYSTAYYRMQLLVKSGIIGEVISVDATCTSLDDAFSTSNKSNIGSWNSITTWGPTALLPVFQLLGTAYNSSNIISMFRNKNTLQDSFTKVTFTFPKAVASIKVGNGVKSEGELVISGTKGYVYIPAPWWKTDYFEVRFENTAETKKYYYQLEGEGIRYELVAFIKAIKNGKNFSYINNDISQATIKLMEKFFSKNFITIGNF